MTALRCLVACEESAVIRDALISMGHDAVSCDLVPSRRPGPHILGDVQPHLREPWDLVIAHPPCKFLAHSGTRWLYKGGRKENGRDEERWRNMVAGCDFYAEFWEANTPCLAIENSDLSPHAIAILIEAGLPMGDRYKAQPWHHATDEDGPDNVTKAAVLLTRGLPRLVPTGTVSGKTARPECHFAAPGPDRERDRAETRPALGFQMALQFSQAAEIARLV